MVSALTASGISAHGTSCAVAGVPDLGTDQLGHGLALEQVDLGGQPDQDVTGGRRLDRLAAVQEHPPDPHLQRLDPLADRGRGDVELASGGVEGTGPNGRGQGAQGHGVEGRGGVSSH